MRVKTYYYYKEHGICVDCKKEKTDGKTRCAKCRAKHREYHNSDFIKAKKKMIYKELTEKGLCVDCRTEKAEEGYVRCKPCKTKKHEYIKEWQRRNYGVGETVDEQLQGK